MKDQKPTQKQKPAKERTPVAAHANSSLAQEFAALSQAPHYAIAAPSKPSPVAGGHCNTNPYLCTLYGLIMRQQRYPQTARANHIEGAVVVAFWLDERGDLVHQAVYKTSGHPQYVIGTSGYRTLRIATEHAQFATFMMLFFGRLDAEKGWVKQLHLGALRNSNSRRLRQLGPDTGFD